MITVGLIGSEASSGLSSSIPTGSLIFSSRSKLKSFFSGKSVSEQSLRDWERDVGSYLFFNR